MAHESRDPEKVKILKGVAAAGDGPVDLVEAGMALAKWRNQGVDLGWYRDHLRALAGDVAKRLETPPDVREASAALAESLAHTYGYVGDTEHYDDVQNADLIRVIDRRRGLPVALSILYIAVARAQGWEAHGIGFPGHFMIALQIGGERAILDPFHGCAARGPADLRALVKGVLGPDGELKPAHYAAIPDVRMLLRLADNMRVRLAELGRTREALSVVGDMLLLAPGAPWLMREQAILSVKVGQFGQAIETLTALVADPALDAQARHDAASLLQKVRSQLN